MHEEKEIIEEIAKYLGVAPTDVEPGKFLREDLELGPIEINELLNALADKFNVVFDPNAAEEIDKVEDLVAMVEDLMIE